MSPVHQKTNVVCGGVVLSPWCGGVAWTSTTFGHALGSTDHIQSRVMNIISVESLQDAVSESVLVMATMEHEY
jgi:hypothetical protein